MRTLELFAGTGSFSKVAKRRGHSRFRVELDTDHEAELHADISTLSAADFAPMHFDIIWASPPCQAFSVAAIGKNWEKRGGFLFPKHERAVAAIELVRHTLQLIHALEPRFWVIENPRGALRKMDIVSPFFRSTVTYCQYGDERMKPTDLWSNVPLILKQPCKSGDPCHTPAPRGSRTGTQGIVGARDRSVVPPALIEDILLQLEWRASESSTRV